MTANPQLTTDLQQQVRLLEDDLRERVESRPVVADSWREEHDEALEAGRTAWSSQQWRDDRVNQAAVAWVLLSVFVRFCEDNGLIKPVWIGGVGPRRQEALDARNAYFRANPEHTDREWLSQPIDYLSGLPATQALVDWHSPLHTVSPSGDAAGALLAFWRERDEDGAALRDLTDPDRSTRFLGDLYQDLSQHAKDTYALLQTPEFVEEFILDRTMEPALAERPLDGFRIIDPTCGSGHFLLGAFDRLLDRWHRHAPGLETRARVQAALDAIHGVDINPFAVAIARFRLTVAALAASGLQRLEDAPAFSYHIAVGDSLLHGSDQHELDYGPEHDPDAGASGFAYTAEDLHALREILQPGRYDVVVGNPPYITAKDSALNDLYRKRYNSCHREYGLNIPFCERMYCLAKDEGMVGQITSNQFMKRHSGVKLVTNFFPVIDLTYVLDTSGVHIPSHGIPTVILIGRCRSPKLPTVRVALSIRSEPGIPCVPAQGNAWLSLLEHVDSPGSINRYFEVADWRRDRLRKHPWMLQAGAYELVESMTDRGCPLMRRCSVVGYTGQTNADPAFVAPMHAMRRRSVEADSSRMVVSGEAVRDFSIENGPQAIWPYSTENLRDIYERPGAYAWLWPSKTNLWARATFAKSTYRNEGRTWWEWHQVSLGRMQTPLSLSYSNVSSHNHFSDLLLFPWAGFHDRPGSGGQSPPRVSPAMAINASGEW